MHKNPFKTSNKVAAVYDDESVTIAQTHEANRLLQEQKFEQVVENLGKLTSESSDEEVLEELAIEHIEEQPKLAEVELLETMVAEVEKGKKIEYIKLKIDYKCMNFRIDDG